MDIVNNVKAFVKYTTSREAHFCCRIRCKEACNILTMWDVYSKVGISQGFGANLAI